MTKTRIEWCDYTLNPVKGLCPGGCDYCYARRMYHRFRWNPAIRFDWEEIYQPRRFNDPLRIFVGSMIDMYHPKIDSDWVEHIINSSQLSKQHIFITLTKYPQNLSQYEFPENWWVGVTVDSWENLDRVMYLRECKSIHGKKFVSFEPLLTPIFGPPLQGIDWIIVGGLTPKPVHTKGWIDYLVYGATERGIPVFIKKNAHYPIKRQDFPE